MIGPALRRLWLKLHRWLGITLGLLLAMVALAGAVLIAWKPVDRWLNPTLFNASQPGPLSLDAARATLRRTFGPDARLNLRPPRDRHDTVWAFIDGNVQATAYVNPADGKLLGWRAEHDHAAGLIFAFHSELLLGDTGRHVLAVLAAAYLFLLASGLVLWWPVRWRHAFSVQWRARPLRVVLDAHKAGGALLGVFIAVSIASGVWMAWKPLPNWVNALSGHKHPVVPPVPPGAHGQASLDRMAADALRAFPGARVGYVVLSAGDKQPIRVRLKLADDPHPNGLTSLWFHPATGELLATHRWDALPAGTRSTTWIYPLHSGQLGGSWHLALNAALGLALAALTGSGVWMWWQRRPRPAASRAETARISRKPLR